MFQEKDIDSLELNDRLKAVNTEKKLNSDYVINLIQNT